MYIFSFLFNMAGVVVWFFPPFRQYRTKFFLFFTVLALADLSGLFFTHYMNPHSNHIVYIITAVTSFFTLLEKKFTIKYIIIYFLLVTSISILFISTHNLLISILTILIFNLLILGLLSQEMLKDFFHTRIFSIFIGVLILYQLITITKISTLLTGFTNNYAYFWTTTAFQILFGLFFSIYRYDNKRFILQFK